MVVDPLSALMLRDLEDTLGRGGSSVLIPATTCVAIEVDDARGLGARLAREPRQVSAQKVVLEDTRQPLLLPELIPGARRHRQASRLPCDQYLPQCPCATSLPLSVLIGSEARPLDELAG